MLEEALAGADLVVNVSASPYDKGKGLRRERMLIQRARDNLCAVAFCALVGGQDELVFDGQSCIVDHDGCVLARAPQFAEHLLVATVDPGAAQAARLRDTRQRPATRDMEPKVDQLRSLTTRHEPRAQRAGGGVADLLDADSEVYAALVLGTRDYVHKNGFDHVVIGLSGG